MLRTQTGDAAFLKALNGSASGDWCALETLRALPPRRLAALNYGTIKVPLPGGEGSAIEQRCRAWAAETGLIKLTGTSVDPIISMPLSDVDTGEILANAQHAENTGNRLQKVRQLLFEELDIEYESTF